MNGAELVDLIRYICTRWQETADTCSLLDNALGDGDHGVSIKTGARAVLAKLSDYEGGSPSDVLRGVGGDFLRAVGASIGPLYATGLLRMSQTMAGKEIIAADDVSGLFVAFVGGLSDRGKAGIGEKTMMDVWLPALFAFEQAIIDIPLSNEALTNSCQAALWAGYEGVKATKEMVATKGRASRLGDRSKGTIDPGAYSAYQLLCLVMERCAGIRYPGLVVQL